MEAEIPYYHRSIDWNWLMAEYPPPPHYHRTVGKFSAEQIFDLQNRRFMARMAEAWQIPFYRQRWSAAGLEPGDIRSLHDIERIPIFTSDDLRKAIEDAPPFGSHHPLGRKDLGKIPIKIQTSGGTTGMPRVTLFDPMSMEIQGIQTARGFYAQGARPGDLIQIPLTTSLANAGWTAYTAAFGWLGCVPVTTGSGKVTPSERQLEYAAAWGVNGWYTMGDYLGRLTQVAADIGFDLHKLPTKYIFTFLGPDADGALRKAFEDAWGAPLYDNYGSHEIGLVAFECALKTRHINEDTAYLEICDEVDGHVLPDGQIGNVVATSLYRSIPPFIRYNLRDRMARYPHTTCLCGLCSRTMSAMMGRADEMVKLRGTNIYPLACQSAIKKDPRTSGEYICVVLYKGESINRQEEMVVRVERRSTDVDSQALADDLRKALYNDLGARVDVEIVDYGALADVCGIGEKQKRLLDLRRR
jgi:phenylacetate-CoA ligase